MASVPRWLIAPNCHQVGCDMRFAGGRNAGCDLGNDCSCSVPVKVCRRCGDSDYGDSDEAVQIIRECAERREETECQVPGCGNQTDRGICDDCDRWVDDQVAALDRGTLGDDL